MTKIKNLKGIFFRTSTSLRFFVVGGGGGPVFVVVIICLFSVSAAQILTLTDFGIRETDIVFH